MYNLDYGQYLVKSGDTLYKIAKYYNTTPEVIMSMNNLMEPLIYPNQILYVPYVNNGSNSVYITEPNDTINTIVAKTGITYDQLYNQNNVSDLYLAPNQKINIGRKNNSFDTIKNMTNEFM